MTRRYAPATTWIIILSLLISLGASFTFSRRAVAQSKPDSETGRTAVTYPQLSKYATDLTLRALEGKLDTIRNRDAEVARVIASCPPQPKRRL
jgi:ATP-dependent Clp protease ATP-binding subunit ClpA